MLFSVLDSVAVSAAKCLQDRGDATADAILVTDKPLPTFII